MRILLVALLPALVAGCITIAPLQSAAPSVEATQSPTATPTPGPSSRPEPTPSPTVEPTPTPTADSTETPSGTADPNATPRPTVVDLLPYLSSQITVINVSDQALSMSVALLSTDSDEELSIGTFELEPLQVTSQAVVPARFRLMFYLGAGFHVGTCRIDIGDGEQLQFAVIEDGIALASSGAEPADPEEMLVETSSRCQAEAGTT